MFFFMFSYLWFRLLCHVGATTCLGPVHFMCFNPLSCCLRYVTTVFVFVLNKHDYCCCCCAIPPCPLLAVLISASLLMRQMKYIIDKFAVIDFFCAGLIRDNQLIVTHIPLYSDRPGPNPALEWAKWKVASWVVRLGGVFQGVEDLRNRGSRFGGRPSSPAGADYLVLACSCSN